LEIAIIVEGKNDKIRLSRVLSPDVPIHCTYGTLNAGRLESLRKTVGQRQVYLFLDNDASGRRIRGMLGDVFPDAEHLYTRRGYRGVEGTPEEYLIQQLEKAGLEEYIAYPEPEVPYRPLPLETGGEDESKKAPHPEERVKNRMRNA
jgi:toprim domain protein